jgi:hypothetical protein
VDGASILRQFDVCVGLDGVALALLGLGGDADVDGGASAVKYGVGYDVSWSESSSIPLSTSS